MKFRKTAALVCAILMLVTGILQFMGHNASTTVSSDAQDIALTIPDPDTQTNADHNVPGIYGPQRLDAQAITGSNTQGTTTDIAAPITQVIAGPATPTTAYGSSLPDIPNNSNEDELGFLATKCKAKKLLSDKGEKLGTVYLDRANGVHWVDLEDFFPRVGMIYCAGQPSETEPLGHNPCVMNLEHTVFEFVPGRPVIVIDSIIAVETSHYGATMATTPLGYKYVAGIRQVLSVLYMTDDVSQYIVGSTESTLTIKTPKVDWQRYERALAMFQSNMHGGNGRAV